MGGATASSAPAVLLLLLLPTSSALPQQPAPPAPPAPPGGSVLEVLAGSSVSLPCPLHLPPATVRLWSRGERLLFAGELRVRHDARLQLAGGGRLLLEQVQPGDEGTFTCQVEDEDKQLRAFSYEVVVLQQATATIEVGSHLTVKQGTSLALTCSGTGQPEPEVRWVDSRGRVLGRGRGQAGVLLEFITREDAGLLECEADNGVGPAAKDSLSLDVLYAPEVEMLPPHLAFQPGCGLELQCLVHSPAAPAVQWRQEDRLLQPGLGITMWSLDNLHVLQLARCDHSVLGEFSCRAENSQGRATASVSVTQHWVNSEILKLSQSEEETNNVRREVEGESSALALQSSSRHLAPSLALLPLLACTVAMSR